MRPRRSHNQSFTVFVSESDQKRLKQFALHELAFYNTIVECMESRTRAFPKQVAELTPTQIEILCEFVKSGTTWAQVMQDATWQKPHMQLWRKDFAQGDKLLWPSWLQHVAQTICNVNMVLIPETKAIMTRTLLEFYRDQAQILKEPLHSEKEDISYRVPPQNISKQDAHTKRHVQIPRTSVKIKYDSDADQTLIQTPLTHEPIQIPGINLNEREGWHMLVIRQEPGRYVTPDTPWLAEFKHTHNQYLIRLLDVGSNRKPT